MKKLGSEKDIHSGSGLFKPKLWSRQIFKKGMAYFLCFVLLVGSMQGISCAEGNLEEIAERIESEEPQSVSHDSENEQKRESPDFPKKKHRRKKRYIWTPVLLVSWQTMTLR